MYNIKKDSWETHLGVSTNVIGSLRIVSALGEPAPDGGTVGGRVVGSAAREASEQFTAPALHFARPYAGPSLVNPLQLSNKIYKYRYLNP